ncbi:MAG: YifB family Mg chelatase-like AAA ATPase [Candidatus Melainabacteria bacterium]|nr:YifB family Mg chelatase-like AAA ATPase [Candidatus Melainabacteria bacterium]
MFARVYSGGLTGVEAYRIEVEVDAGGGIGQILIVGLPDAAVKESQERVRSAIKACSFLMPPGKKWVVNLAPADTRKEGPAYDLPIAVGILAATGYLPTESLADFWLIGELGLDGSLRPVSGVLPLSIACESSGMKNIVVPEANADEAALVEGLTVYPVSHLKQVCSIITDAASYAPLNTCASEMFRLNQQGLGFDYDYADVKGQEHAKRALEIAAAGRHNILMVGPPGSGKSMLACRLPSIMPPLEFAEALELTKLYSVAGRLSNKRSLVCHRPFRAPHHSASATGLIGGGSIPKPGEISLSHLGILFLDELTEFPRGHLEVLRQPLETGNITISRAQQTLTYPASFLLVGACNPCSCGYRGDPVKYCVCTPSQAERYWARLSGPLLDRIDLHVDVSRLKENELASTECGESSELIRLRVLRAVERQRMRSPGRQATYNGQLNHQQVLKFCQVDDQSRTLLARAITQLGLSARAYDRVLRVSRTIADLSDSEKIMPMHVAEAIQYRGLKHTVGV